MIVRGGPNRIVECAAFGVKYLTCGSKTKYKCICVMKSVSSIWSSIQKK